LWEAIRAKPVPMVRKLPKNVVSPYTVNMNFIFKGHQLLVLLAKLFVKLPINPTKRSLFSKIRDSSV
jgi:hypothetical protein